MAETLKKNAVITLTCTDLNGNGDGIGRLEGGLVVFCRGLLPGERGQALIIKVRPSYAIGKLLFRENDSPLRRPENLICAHFKNGCGSCALCHVNEEGQLELAAGRVRDCLVRIGGIDRNGLKVENCISPAGAACYRNKTVYPFFSENGRIKTGFYARGSHRPVLLEGETGCLHEHPLAAKIRRSAEKIFDEAGLSVYDEEKNDGLLRHLTVRVSEYESEAMAIVTVNSDRLPDEPRIAALFREAVPELGSLWVNENRAATNVILGPALHLILGSETLRCRLGPACFDISPESFFQVNTFGAELLYETVYRLSALSPDDSILDLYCGAGTIGIYLLKRFIEERGQKDPAAAGDVGRLPALYGIEIVEAAVANARRNAVLNGLEASYWHGSVPEVLPSLLKSGSVLRPTTAIIDPPRKGCDQPLLETLLELAPAKLIYVSCDPATLARDLRILTGRRTYEVKCVQPVNMFPDTGHVETVVLMSRVER